MPAIACIFLTVCLCLRGGVWARRVQLEQKGIPEADKSLKRGLVNGKWNAMDHKCNKLEDPGFKPIKICRDKWEQIQQLHGKPCIAYDVGVRDIADFALVMIENFGCTVRAYDPSPTTALWWDEAKYPNGQPRAPADKKDLLKLKEQEQAGRYTLREQAAGGTDGDLKLYAYNWQQISTFRATKETQSKQKEYIVPSRTLSTMMEEHGDKHIDVLKVDIEGSEFPFLNAAFDKMGCPPVEHILLEWHSQHMDILYGAPPEVKALEDKMGKCGYKRYSHYPFFSNHVTEQEDYDIHLTYFGHAAYCKTCVE